VQKVYIDLNRKGGDQVGRQSLGKGNIPIHTYVKIDKEGNTERTMLVLFENKNDKYEEWVNTNRRKRDRSVWQKTCLIQ